MQTQQMGKEEYNNKEAVFIHKVCRTHCRLCAVKHPEFCMFFLANLGRKYFNNILLLVKIARERKPRLIETLKSFEGFAALFCNPEVCHFHTGKCNTRQKLDCYQIYLTQSGQFLEDGEADSLLMNWDVRLYKEVCHELDGLAKTVNSMGKKERKRLFKIGKHISNMMDRWRVPDKNRHSSNEACKVKKEVTTQMFHNDNEEWAAKIKSILGGDNSGGVP